MDIKYVLILLNVVLMFIIMIILYARERVKAKKLRSEFETLKTSMEKSKEDADVENKIRELKEKAELIINDMNDTVRSDFNSVSNKKIIEFEEYANQLFEKINMNHKEVVFLYDMLNDKAASINELYTKLHEKELIIKNLINQTENLITKDSSVDDIEVVEEEFKDVLEFCSEYRNDLDDEHDDVQNPVEEDSSDYQVQNEEIIKLYSMGYSTKEISKKLGIGTGEVALVNNLYNSSVIV